MLPESAWRNKKGRHFHTGLAETHSNFVLISNLSTNPPQRPKGTANKKKKSIMNTPSLYIEYQAIQQEK